jgi:hypothetical protein
MTDNLRFALHGGWQVLWVSLLFGAGLPVLFALGVRSLAWGSDGGTHVASTSGAQAAPLVGKVLAVVCFAVVVVCVALGITVIVAAGLGKEMSFEHVFPTLVPKS